MQGSKSDFRATRPLCAGLLALVTAGAAMAQGTSFSSVRSGVGPRGSGGPLSGHYCPEAAANCKLTVRAQLSRIDDADPFDDMKECVIRVQNSMVASKATRRFTWVLSGKAERNFRFGGGPGDAGVVFDNGDKIFKTVTTATDRRSVEAVIRNNANGEGAVTTDVSSYTIYLTWQEADANGNLTGKVYSCAGLDPIIVNQDN